MTLSQQPTGNDEMCWESSVGEGGQNTSRVGKRQVRKQSEPAAGLGTGASA